MSNQTVNFLRTFNRWRRGDESLEQPSPRVIGQMIDDACDQIEQWRACAERLHATVCYLAPQILKEDGFTAEKEAVREFIRLKEGK
jgi:hypothetical protein